MLHGVVFITMYFFSAKWAWFTTGVFIILSAFFYVPADAHLGLTAETGWRTKLYKRIWATKTPFLGMFILLLSYLHFNLGVIPYPLLFVGYIIGSGITGYFIEELPWDLTGRGINFGLSPIISTAFVLLFYYKILK